MDQKPLTPQQEAFARKVASGLSQAESYRQAYPKSQKWKDGAVWSAASRLMADCKVSARARVLQDEQALAAGLDVTRVLREVAMLAHSDIGNIMHADGKVKLPHELDPVTRAAIASFEIDEFGRIKYKFWDKNAALEKAMKHLGQYEVDNKQKAELVGVVRLVPLEPSKGQAQ